MPRLTDETRDARRRQILDAAAACFRRRGFTGTSMAEIIRESGLSAGSIYSHFSSKDEILQATAERTLQRAERILAEAASAEQAVTPRGIARTVPRDVVDRDLMRMFLQLWSEAVLDPRIAQLARGILRRVRDLMAGALLPWARRQGDAGPAEELARRRADGLLALMHGYFVRISVDPGLDTPEFLEGIVELLPED
ncbi:TetR/AcrR family transcriptional regulator [Rothia kristinae]|uniref:TetR/AcrR family transcriptional regulator n=1 Tax=Rothia kristinae TaxID=37923 RepID=UPI0021A957A6|nr:TetR/AcrR family transcriptional regulator [Rothia kristinae]MCT1356392.1 TetR/AcrR family transcriptional regulator [Rothia kristinae]MCT1392949.1 TetR/AcrR family transcriptional regulator [Rothia kristinae]MCT1505613.1 TetR/AcrR family transcriptional regulator [Rothia kristinae]MCT2038125.1 TetR/AcrR family transcriptional regulator [Rothia kristinae]MCT2243268.1 TetR/AcrR family transcriptional regulator [Rothia kristinae]